MGKAKRCRTVVIGASVVALGTVGTCPAANAAKDAPTPSQPVVATIAHKHDPYVYEATLGGELSSPNTSCSGATIRLARVTLSPEGRNAGALWQRHPSAWNGTFTFNTVPTTKITASWQAPAQQREAEEEAATHNGEVNNPRLQGQEDTTTASTICAATTPNAALGSIGMGAVTWRLPKPVTSVAALLRHAPASIQPNEYTLAFEVLPNGTVPAFSPGSSA